MELKLGSFFVRHEIDEEKQHADDDVDDRFCIFILTKISPYNSFLNLHSCIDSTNDADHI